MPFMIINNQYSFTLYRVIIPTSPSRPPSPLGPSVGPAVWWREGSHHCTSVAREGVELSVWNQDRPYKYTMYRNSYCWHPWSISALIGIKEGVVYLRYFETNLNLLVRLFTLSWVKYRNCRFRISGDHGEKILVIMLFHLKIMSPYWFTFQYMYYCIFFHNLLLCVMLILLVQKHSYF